MIKDYSHSCSGTCDSKEIWASFLPEKNRVKHYTKKGRKGTSNLLLAFFFFLTGYFCFHVYENSVRLHSIFIITWQSVESKLNLFVRRNDDRGLFE